MVRIIVNWFGERLILIIYGIDALDNHYWLVDIKDSSIVKIDWDIRIKNLHPTNCTRHKEKH